MAIMYLSKENFTCPIVPGTTLGGDLSEIFAFSCTISPLKLGKEK